MLRSKSAVITGASQGLGKVIARAYLAAGANIAILARDGAMLASTAKELKASGDGSILTFVGDVTDDAFMREVFANSIRRFGRLDVLVNNAGVYGPKGWTEEVSLDEWRRAVDINLIGTLIPMRHALPHFKANRKGKIINLSGGGATNPMPQISAYAAAKAAVVRLTETIALEVKDYNIDVNSIAAGALNTRFLEEVLEAGPEKVGKAFYERALEQKRTGGASPEIAAELCVYLASEASNGVSGRLVSALWDNWQSLAERREEIQGSDIYTLRRITAKDRGHQNWDK